MRNRPNSQLLKIMVFADHLFPSFLASRGPIRRLLDLGGGLEAPHDDDHRHCHACHFTPRRLPRATPPLPHLQHRLCLFDAANTVRRVASAWSPHSFAMMAVSQKFFGLLLQTEGRLTKAIFEPVIFAGSSISP